MTLENLLRTGLLKAHAADERELQRLLDSAQLALQDAAFADRVIVLADTDFGSLLACALGTGDPAIAHCRSCER